MVKIPKTVRTVKAVINVPVNLAIRRRMKKSDTESDTDNRIQLEKW